MSLGVSCRGLVYIYRLEGYDVVALAGVDLEIAPGESVALLGPSGSGKSTLLSLLAGLLTPSAGRLTVGDHDVAKASEAELQAMRASDVGVVLQGSARNLLPYLSVEQNVRFAQRSVVGEARRALPPPREVLSIVGLTVRARYRARPGELSPAERQRLALAVALACRPGLLLADEPTSQLDSRSRDEVVSALDAVRRTGTTVIVVTHDPDVGARMGRTVTIRDGRVGGEGHSGVDFSVIGRDGSVHLPPEILGRFPAGTLLHVQERPDGTIVLIPAQAGAPVTALPSPAAFDRTASTPPAQAMPDSARPNSVDPADTVTLPSASETAQITSNTSVTATAAVPGQRTFSLDRSSGHRGETS